MKKNSSTDTSMSPVKTNKQLTVHTSSDIDNLKLKEIENVNIERIRKQSEKLNINKGALVGPSRKIELADDSRIDENDESYINLHECSSHKISFNDFNIVKLIGKGSFGKVKFNIQSNLIQSVKTMTYLTKFCLWESQLWFSF